MTCNSETHIIIGKATSGVTKWSSQTLVDMKMMYCNIMYHLQLINFMKRVHYYQNDIFWVFSNTPPSFTLFFKPAGMFPYQMHFIFLQYTSLYIAINFLIHWLFSICLETILMAKNVKKCKISHFWWNIAINMKRKETDQF